MSFILLLDQNVPIGLMALLSGHAVEITSRIGWGEFTNGVLLGVAEKAGYDALITADQNIQFQQNLYGRKLALIVLSTNHWPTVRANAPAIVSAVEAITPGSYTRIELERPPAYRRRPVAPRVDC